MAPVGYAPWVYAELVLEHSAIPYLRWSCPNENLLAVQVCGRLYALVRDNVHVEETSTHKDRERCVAIITPIGGGNRYGERCLSSVEVATLHPFVKVNHGIALTWAIFIQRLRIRPEVCDSIQPEMWFPNRRRK